MSKNVSFLEKYSDYEVVIGIEVHVQLKTKSKMFCGCQSIFGALPNTNICRVCTGMLGSLPVVNLLAVNYAMSAGLATNCTISRISEFARKHYVYPDLPKNYQITQDDKPICFDGYLLVDLPLGVQKKIRIKRIHMEEDAGKTIHGDGEESFVDLNRAGTPLIEIVSEPDISSAEEAVAYLEQLKMIVEYIGVSNANMEEGSFRADVNISVKKKIAKELGTKVELKNINSFRFITDAIEFEIRRQITALESGEKIFQETRLWDSDKKETVFMRSKEFAEDYRYFNDPDLPSILVDDEWIRRIEEQLPELPKQRLARMKNDYSLSDYEAEIISSDRELADYFEQVVKHSNLPKKAANWVLRDILGIMKEEKLSLSEIAITPEMLGELLLEIEKGVVSTKIANEIFAEMAVSGKYPSIIIQEKGLEKVSSIDQLEAVVKKVLEQNPKQAADFKSGNQRILPFLVGQAMKETKGKGDPVILTQLFNKEF